MWNSIKTLKDCKHTTPATWRCHYTAPCSMPHATLWHPKCGVSMNRDTAPDWFPRYLVFVLNSWQECLPTYSTCHYNKLLSQHASKPPRSSWYPGHLLVKYLDGYRPAAPTPIGGALSPDVFHSTWLDQVRARKNSSFTLSFRTGTPHGCMLSPMLLREWHNCSNYYTGLLKNVQFKVPVTNNNQDWFINSQTNSSFLSVSSTCSAMSALQ